MGTTLLHAGAVHEVGHGVVLRFAGRIDFILIRLRRFELGCPRCGQVIFLSKTCAMDACKRIQILVVKLKILGLQCSSTSFRNLL